MTTITMPPDAHDKVRIYTIRWNWGGAGKHRVHVLIKYSRHDTVSCYTYPGLKGKAALVVSLARNPTLAKEVGATIHD